MADQLNDRITAATSDFDKLYSAVENATVRDDRSIVARYLSDGTKKPTGLETVKLTDYLQVLPLAIDEKRINFDIPDMTEQQANTSVSNAAQNLERAFHSIQKDRKDGYEPTDEVKKHFIDAAKTAFAHPTDTLRAVETSLEKANLERARKQADDVGYNPRVTPNPAPPTPVAKASGKSFSLSA